MDIHLLKLPQFDLHVCWTLYLCHRGCLPTGVDKYTGMTLGCLYTLLRVDMGWTNTH